MRVALLMIAAVGHGACAAASSASASAASPSPAPLFPGRCGIAVTDPEAAEIAENGWLNDYDGSLGFWYNWNDATTVEVKSGEAVLPFLPMWWGAQVWKDHPAQLSWCNKTGSSKIATETGPTSLSFGWNEPIGGAACKYSMGACHGGNYTGLKGAARAANNFTGCIDGAKKANRLTSTPCLNNIDPDWFRAFVKNRPPSDAKEQPITVCCSHIYASQYNGGWWDDCDLDKMTNMDKLTGQLQGLVDDGTCDHHFIQEIGIGGCPTADANVSELLIKNLGNAVRNIPSVYLGWFANSQGDGGTSRKTTWLFQENAGTVGKAYKDMCSSLDRPKPPTPPAPTPTPPPSPSPPSRGKCSFGDAVNCPGSTAMCAGNQCCQDGTTCPSAARDFKSCPKGKTWDCTHGVEVIV